jgi:nicotinamide-nucleotide amidase
MQAYLIGIGDELLMGQVVDTNTVWMAQQLNALGVGIAGKMMVSDEPASITEALDWAYQKADVVLLTGGLGATKDDITKKVLADCFKTPLVLHQPTLDRMAAFMAKLNRPVNDAQRAIALQPESAAILENSAGLCPGMWFEPVKGKVVVSMPGVPFEMQAIMTEHVMPRLRPRVGIQAVEHHTMVISGMGETEISERVAAIESQLPTHVRLAYLPSVGYVRLRLTATGNDAEVLKHENQHLAHLMAELIGSPVLAHTDMPLAAILQQHLTARQQTMTLAESCTGGLISHLLTLQPGISAVFRGGVVVYDNVAKIELLGVSAATIGAHGAVSEPVVFEMATKARALFHTDYAIAVSGIAGPGGATATKSVGTFCVGLAGPHHVRTFTLGYPRDRRRNIEFFSHSAMGLLIRHVDQL